MDTKRIENTFKPLNGYLLVYVFPNQVTYNKYGLLKCEVRTAHYRKTSLTLDILDQTRKVHRIYCVVQRPSFSGSSNKAR